MDRRMFGRHHPLTAGSPHPGTRVPVRLDRSARSAWRPDFALCVSVLGLVLGVVVLISLLSAIAPGPPSLSVAPSHASRTPARAGGLASRPTARGPRPPGSPTASVRPAGANATYPSGAGVVARGVAYVPLSVARASSITLPGSAGVIHGRLLIVKLVVRGVSASPTTASVGLVDLVAGGVDYRPLLPVAAALSHSRWQTLVLKGLTAGTTKRVKLVFAVAPGGTLAGLQLLVGSHAAGARRFAIPVGPAV